VIGVHDGRRVLPPGRLAALVRGHRVSAGLTQRQLAMRAGIGLGALEDLEQGRTVSPREESLARLAEALALNPCQRAELSEVSAAVAGRGTPPRVAGGPGGAGPRVAVLGPLSLMRGELPVAVGPVRLRAVLGLLALRAGAGMSRTALVEALWGEDPPRTAVAMIQAQVSRVRRLLGPMAPPDGTRLAWDGSCYRLSLSGLRLDLAEFSDLAEQARQAVAAGAVAAACGLYQRSLELWRGQVLDDVDLLRGHPAVTGLNRRRAEVVIEYASAAADAGLQDQVIVHLEALAAREPLDERAHAQLMRALAATGRQATALHLYAGLARRLDAELGVRPGPELAAAHLEVLRQEVRPAAARTAVARRAVPRQLPADVWRFVGRAAELATLTQLLDQAAEAGGTVVISAIGGTAGVGKTALAVHWAHQVAGRFPDGQLYIDLRGFGPIGTAMTAAAAVRLFLDGLGVAAERIPADPDAQAALYRSLLAGRRMLVVADNARDADQVRPLLPGAPGCLVLVTSRNQLTGLAASHGSRLLTLGLLTEAEAGDLLERRLGQERTAAEPAAVTELAGLCARLPLALSVAAARAAARPGLPLAELAGELRGTRARLDGLRTDDAATDVRTVFSWSYGQLSRPAARLFRLLGVHPGPDITVPAAASLAALPLDAARSALTELAWAHLITEHLPGRYAFHDLLRAYAAEQAEARDTGDARRAALHRALDHYLHTAYAASRLMNPHRDQITLCPARPQVRAQQVTALDQALDWFEAEWRVLLGAVALAVSEGFPDHTWQLFWAMATFLFRKGYLGEMVAAGQSALIAARQLGDLGGEAAVRRHLGRAQTVLGAGDEGGEHATFSLNREAGRVVAEARAQVDVVDLYYAQRRHRAALPDGQEALRLCRAAGFGRGEALALNAVGWTLAQVGRYQEALVHCSQALAMCGELSGDNVAQSYILDSVGYLHSRLGHHDEAISCYQQAIGLLTGTPAVTLRAVMLANMGDAYDAAGDPGAARRAWQEALAILDDLRHPEADRLRSRLA
jgi:DNA-binding SARP family transcriptional activator